MWICKGAVSALVEHCFLWNYARYASDDCVGCSLAEPAQGRWFVLEVLGAAGCSGAAVLPCLPCGVHAGVAGEDEREGGAMKWSPARDEGGKWRLERFIQGSHVVRRGGNGECWASRIEHLATVERADASPLILEPAAYRAEVVSRAYAKKPNWGQNFWRSAPALFPTLREAQLWCEREVRFMEVGELA